jgi:putative transcriptional regulator
VVLLLQHNQDGAFGLVLNRPMEKKLRRLWRQLQKSPQELNCEFSFGGPMAGPPVALQDPRRPSQMTAGPDAGGAVELGAGPAGRRACRVFIGHSGWKPGQLESELKLGAWMTLPATPEHVFGRHEDLWVATVRQIGRSVVQAATRIDQLPDDPLRN